MLRMNDLCFSLSGLSPLWSVSIGARRSKKGRGLVCNCVKNWLEENRQNASIISPHRVWFHVPPVLFLDACGKEGERK